MAVEAHVETAPGGDKIGKVTFESVDLTIYRSPNDGAFVIEIDTQVGTGEIRVYVNDGQVFARDPEEDNLPQQHRTVIAKCVAEAWRNIEQGDATTEADVAADIVTHLSREYLGAD